MTMTTDLICCTNTTLSADNARTYMETHIVYQKRCWINDFLRWGNTPVLIRIRTFY